MQVSVKKLPRKAEVLSLGFYFLPSANANYAFTKGALTPIELNRLVMDHPKPLRPMARAMASDLLQN